MEAPLTPLDFLRRARKLYADREAVVDGQARFTYAQFGDRIDRWSAALQALGVERGDRVAYISPNTHSNLEGYYAVPQIGAVIVPCNYRLTADDFAYLIEHSGAKVVCAHADQLAAIDQVRDRLPASIHFVALEGSGEGWLEYESLLGQAASAPALPTIDERDLLSINYTSGTTSRPKGVMITHRNAYINAVGTLIHLPMHAGERYLWTLPMFHANGWTFTWIVTAVGGTHVCVRKVDAAQVYQLIRDERIDDALCRADGADRPGQRRRRAARAGAARPARRHRGRAAGGGHHPHHRRRARVDRDAGVWPHRNVALHHGLRAEARASRAVGRRGREGQGAPGRRADHVRASCAW